MTESQADQLIAQARRIAEARAAAYDPLAFDWERTKVDGLGPTRLRSLLAVLARAREAQTPTRDRRRTACRRR